MDIKKLNVADKVTLKTKDKNWNGIILESYDSEIILLKLDSGYNIGIRESDILSVDVIEKAKEIEKQKTHLLTNPKLRNVALIITGGTISSRLDPKTGGVIPTDEEEILKITPEIKDICNIVKISKPFLKFSEDMGYKDWIKLAQSVTESLNEENIDGVIITHGTDTLHYTSAALSFFLQNLNKPVAITYSQRSIDRGSTDASLNLLCAVKYAVSDIAEVALIGHKDSNDNLCLAMPSRHVRKMHTSIRAAFQIVNNTPLAEISRTDFKILKTFNARDNSKKVICDAKFNDKVTIIKIHPNQDPSILDHYVKKGYLGIILEVTGLGQVPSKKSDNNWLTSIKEAVNNKVIVCATAQTINGTLNPNVYSSGRDLQKTGIIFLNEMLTETAYVKLGWILGHDKWNASEKILEEN